MNPTIKIFNKEIEQRQYLNQFNENNYPLILINKENNLIFFSKDGTNNKIINYDNNKYLSFDFNDINKQFHVIPNDVNNLIISSNGQSETTNIPFKYNKEYEQTPLYKIGLMSDVHYNDHDTNDNDPDTVVDNGDTSEYSEDLKNALSFFNSEHVDFISCSGDISCDSELHFQNYRYRVNKYANNIPTFTCSGNHDTIKKYMFRDIWKNSSVINPGDYQIIYFRDGEKYYNNGEDYQVDPNQLGTSFYFKKYYNNTFDVYIYLNIEYGYNSSNYVNHNCRILTQEELLVHNEVDQTNDVHLYHPQTLECLSEILEEFKDHRCFIFTHPMFPELAGNYHPSSTSGEASYYSYAYNFLSNTYTHNDVMRGDQGTFIKNLMEKYDNNYWFCGHSHYKWIWEKIDHNINVSKIGNSYSIHLPSLARPLKYQCRDYQDAKKDSEAAIMEVYENHVIIKGAVLKEEYSNENMYELIYNYPNNEMEYVTSDMFTIYGNNSSTIEQLEDNYIQINYIYNSSGSDSDRDLHLNNGLINSGNYTNYLPVLRFDDVQIWYDEMTENDTIESITQNITNECKIGFRDTSTSPYSYYFSSNAKYTLYNKGIVFKASQNSSYKLYHLHFKIKMRIGFVSISYINKFLPIACYKLPSK